MPVNDPVIACFAEACGATGPLDLRVDLADGGVLAEGTVPMPFSLVGRDDACDVTLIDAEVNPRHAWLQVIGGRVFAIDLGSRTGLVWPGNKKGSGWMEVGTSARVGPFQIRLRTPVSTRPARIPPAYNPLQSDPLLNRSRPTVTLDFRNGKRAKDRWTINRVITMIGRATDCKINLTTEDIAAYHCGLVLTPDGLWVVDLSGRGVVVNGERMRVSPLRPGSELWVGRFLIGVNYPAASQGSPSRSGTLTHIPQEQTAQEPARPSTPSRPAAVSPSPAIAHFAEDEVELGAVPAPDAASGLPSSHIMADAFRLWSNSPSMSGPVSNPILVSATTTGGPSTPSGTPAPSLPLPTPSYLIPLASEASPDAIVVPLLKQLGELHGQMFMQFQQSLMLMVQVFACLRRDQLPAMQQELARIQELNAELAQLQSEVARRAVEGSSFPPPARTPAPRPAPVTPAPQEQAGTQSFDMDATTLHDWVTDRINNLQRERQTRWQSLVGMFSSQSA
jgi:pSer/pThr/pTyr-binding forkhead associated (FHA) protein